MKTLDHEQYDLIARWRSYHVVYHGDLDQLLLVCVQPLVQELLGKKLIDSYYFVRYRLGGPHVRVRLRIKEGIQNAALVEGWEYKLSILIAKLPPHRSLPVQQILKENQLILQADPSIGTEQSEVFEDKSCQQRELRFEFERYGGVENSLLSLELFCFSSACVLQHLEDHLGSAAGWQLGVFFRLGLRLAIHLARDESEMRALVAYRCQRDDAPVFVSGRSGPDAMFQKQREQLIRVWEKECATLMHDPSSPAETVARSLSIQLDGLPTHRRLLAMMSHLHMTANRLGLDGRQELYVSYLMDRTLRHASVDLQLLCSRLRTRPQCMV